MTARLSWWGGGGPARARWRPSLKGTESDILADGALDWPDAIPERLDVIASVHQRYKLDPAKATARLVRTMQLPIFKTWGHPLGRMLLSRDPIACDVDAVLDAAAAAPVAIELNSTSRASPRRGFLNTGEPETCNGRALMCVICWRKVASSLDSAEGKLGDASFAIMIECAFYWLFSLVLSATAVALLIEGPTGHVFVDILLFVSVELVAFWGVVRIARGMRKSQNYPTAPRPSIGLEDVLVSAMSGYMAIAFMCWSIPPLFAPGPLGEVEYFSFCAALFFGGGVVYDFRAYVRS